MDSESEWDTQSEAEGSPRSRRQDASLNGINFQANNNDEHNHALFIDYSQPFANRPHDSAQQKTISTPRHSQSANQQRRNTDSAYQKAISNQSGVANDMIDRYEQSDDDQASIATVVHNPEQGENQKTVRGTKDKNRNHQGEPIPPFDFSNAYRPDSQQSKTFNRQALPGKDRKGNQYDPSPFNGETTDDDAVLADLRAGMERGKQKEAEARLKQQQQIQKKQQEIKSELEELSRGEPGAKEKVVTKLSGIADHFKSTPKPELKEEADIMHKASTNERDGNAKQYAVHENQDNGRHVTIFPFEMCEREFLRASERKSAAVMPDIADRAEEMMIRLWQEFFALLRIPTSLVLSLLLELMKFVFRDIIFRYILRFCGIIGDFLVKPLLITLFNGFLQPLLTFVWNVLIGVRHASEPILSVARGFSQQIATILGAFRLVDVHWNSPNNSQYHNGSYFDDEIEEVNAQ